VEYVALTCDTTESDLKQRREITSSGSVLHVDLPVVQAAIAGRILILEGLEKVNGIFLQPHTDSISFL